MRTIFRLFGAIIIVAIVMFGLFLAYSTLTCYRPDPEMSVWKSDRPDTISVDSTLQALCWNIGYAGLGDNMDFFYDNGNEVRDTKQRTIENLDSITAFLGRNKDRNFFLLQEVDFKSHRTYNIYQIDYLVKAMNYQNSTGINYDVAFVPIPVKNPMGRVLSGVVTFSNPIPKSSTRYQYPGEFPWPSRIFNLRRCMLVNRYPTSNGKELILVNTHNSAFDDGSLKQQEMLLLKALVLDEYQKGNYVVVGGDWNQSPPKFPLTTFASNYESPSFKLTNIDSSFISPDWTWAFDSAQPTNRYLDEPYVANKNYTGILDFFLLSPNVKLVSCKTRNLQFRNSDHNPVLVSFKLMN